MLEKQQQNFLIILLKQQFNHQDLCKKIIKDINHNTLSNNLYFNVVTQKFELTPISSQTVLIITNKHKIDINSSFTKQVKEKLSILIKDITIAKLIPQKESHALQMRKIRSGDNVLTEDNLTSLLLNKQNLMTTDAMISSDQDNVHYYSTKLPTGFLKQLDSFSKSIFHQYNDMRLNILNVIDPNDLNDLDKESLLFYLLNDTKQLYPLLVYWQKYQLQTIIENNTHLLDFIKKQNNNTTKIIYQLLFRTKNFIIVDLFSLSSYTTEEAIHVNIMLIRLLLPRIILTNHCQLSLDQQELLDIIMFLCQYTKDIKTTMVLPDQIKSNLNLQKISFIDQEIKESMKILI